MKILALIFVFQALAVGQIEIKSHTQTVVTSRRKRRAIKKY